MKVAGEEAATIITGEGEMDVSPDLATGRCWGRGCSRHGGGDGNLTLWPRSRCAAFHGFCDGVSPCWDVLQNNPDPSTPRTFFAPSRLKLVTFAGRRIADPLELAGGRRGIHSVDVLINDR
jgi:hypothetical protein